MDSKAIALAKEFSTMPTKIFVNLPVKDLNKSIELFTKLGFTFNTQFTDENATPAMFYATASVAAIQKIHIAFSIDND